MENILSEYVLRLYENGNYYLIHNPQKLTPISSLSQ